jgi:hypothetical protein
VLADEAGVVRVGARAPPALPDIGAAIGAAARLGLFGQRPPVDDLLCVVTFVGEAHAYTTCLPVERALGDRRRVNDIHVPAVAVACGREHPPPVGLRYVQPLPGVGVDQLGVVGGRSSRARRITSMPRLIVSRVMSCRVPSSSTMVAVTGPSSGQSYFSVRNQDSMPKFSISVTTSSSRNCSRSGDIAGFLLHLVRLHDDCQRRIQRLSLRVSSDNSGGTGRHGQVGRPTLH